LRNCSQVIADFHRQEKGAFTTSEQKEFTKYCLLYENEFLQHVQKVLALIFTPALLGLQTGFTSSEILKQDLTALNKELILEPISHLLQDSLILSAENGSQSEVATTIQESSEGLATLIPETLPAPSGESSEAMSATILESSETRAELDVSSSNAEEDETAPNLPVDIEEVVFQLSDGEDEEAAENGNQSEVLKTSPTPNSEHSESPPTTIPESSDDPTTIPESSDNPIIIPESSEIPPAAAPEMSETSREPEKAEAAPDVPAVMEEVVFHLSDGEEEKEAAGEVSDF